MARRVFFSFHYKRDILRVSQIRNCGVFKSDEVQPFLDKAEWEEIRRQGVKEVKKWIDSQMAGTSVLVLCIGYETYRRKWVRYEIRKAHLENRGIIGIYMHQQQAFKTDIKGINPLDTMHVIRDNKEACLATMYKTYDWIEDGGYENIQKWIEEAAQQAGR